MKKIFKFVPVALAAFALASCSSDDLFGDAAKEQKVKDGLTVKVEALMDEGTAITRQGNVAAGNAVVWEDGDLINVYDNKLAIYDEYAFDGAKFAGINDPDETRIENTQFALFPADRVDYAGWTAAEGAKAVMRIPELVIYDEESEFQAGPEGAKKDVYVSNLPMWGTATGTYPEAEVDLKFLTSVLKVNILNAFANNITFLKVETQDATPISGAFEAILDAENPASAVLKRGASSLTTSNVMYVDLRNVPSYMTYIYLPIIAGHYDYMKVYVTSVEATEAKPLERNADLIVADLDALAPGDWTVIRNWEAGVDFTKSSVKPLSKETQYTLDNIHTCELITKALEQYKNNPGDEDGVLELTVGAADGEGLIISRQLDATDWTIKVPNMAAQKVVINIPDGINNQIDPAAVQTLFVEDANIKDPFDGEIEFNAKKVKGNANINLTVNLPDADFTLTGDFASPKKLENIDVKNVATFTIGNGTDLTSIPYDAALTINTAAAVVVENKATVRTPINLVETKGIESVTIKEGGVLTANSSLSVLKANVTVLGEVNTNVFVYASASTTYIGKNEADGLIQNLFTIGNVQIENKNESEAITGIISALGNNIINVKQGYVKAIVYDNTKGGFKPGTGLYDGKYVVKNLSNLSASDYQAKKVTVHFMEGEGNTAFQEIADDFLEFKSGSDVYNWIVFDNESTWNGKVIDDVKFYDYQMGKNLNKIYTACQLATQGTVDGQKSLYNNINLNDKQWTNPQLNRSFTGLDPRYTNSNKHTSRLDAVTETGVSGKFDDKHQKGIHTIKNLKLQNTQDGIAKNRVAAFGLFGVVMANVKDINIQNFILDKVTCDLAVVAPNQVPYQIGAVAGRIGGNKNVVCKNIEVKNATIGGNAVTGSGTKDARGIRQASTFIGLVQESVAMLDINGNKIAGSVTGQALMGGVIGWDCNDATFVDGNTIATTFSVPTTNVPSNEDFAIGVCGTIGNVVGQFEPNTLATGTLKIGTNKANTITDGITSNRKALGFKFNFLFSGSTKYAFYGGNAAVGYSPNFTKDNLIVNSQKYDPTISKVSSKEKFNELGAALKQNAYIQWTPWAE